ncbi:MAG: hypothetical protein ACRYF0_05765 [Janthinobacterium lividum]
MGQQPLKGAKRGPRKGKKRWVLLLLLLTIGYWKYAPPFNPPSSVFSDPAAEKRYFHNGRDGIVLHWATQYGAYLEAEWTDTGFEDTYTTLNVYRVFKGGWFRPTSRMLLHQYDGAGIDRKEVLFYRKGQEVKLHLKKTGFDETM